MVLQRNSELTFWGWGIPGETISIAPEWMKGEIIKTQVNNTGKWSARVPSGEAGGPYEIRFSGSSEVTLTDVMLGEVWLCSGQSNMEWSANHGIKNGDEETANAHCPNLRIFHVARIAARSLKKTVSRNGHSARPKRCAARVPGLLLRPQHPGRAGRAGRNHRSRMGRNHRRDMDAPRMRNERPGLVQLSV